MEDNQVYVQREDVEKLQSLVAANDLDGVVSFYNNLFQLVAKSAVEDTLRLLPAFIRNLMAQTAHISGISTKFYQENPHFQDHKDVVASTIEELESQNPGAKFEELLEKVVPEINRKLGTLKTLDASAPKRPDLTDLDNNLGIL